MSDLEPKLPEITDPNLALVFARLELMDERQKNDQVETRKALKSMDDRFEPIETFMKNARGGYLAVIGLGAIAASILSVWTFITKFAGRA